MDNRTYTLIVNSCDGFADCWEPFFKLLKVYWPKFSGPIILNTENREFFYPPYNIKSSCAAKGIARKLSWSEALIRTLDQVETDIVLYVQEDYFLCNSVDDCAISEFVSKMRSEDISSIQLTSFGSSWVVGASNCELLAKVHQFSPYRLALQAALWRKDRLRAYIREHENAWQFEIFGTMRAWRKPEIFLALNRAFYLKANRSVFPYVKTGIVKGQWYSPAVIPLFKDNGLEVDFAKRGFFKSRSRFIERLRTVAKLWESPRALIKSLQ